MGGLPCAKNIIDNGASVLMTIHKKMAGLQRQLTCMQATLTLYAQSAMPTEEQEDNLQLLEDH